MPKTLTDSVRAYEAYERLLRTGTQAQMDAAQRRFFDTLAASACGYDEAVRQARADSQECEVREHIGRGLDPNCWVAARRTWRGPSHLVKIEVGR